jgi:hypothetical protein
MKTPNPPPDEPQSVAAIVLAAIEMARAKEASVETKVPDLRLTKKFLKSMVYTFQESRDGLRILVNFPQKLPNGQPVPPGAKPKYQVLFK